MAKNKEEKTNVMRTLEQKKIPYTAFSYDPDGPIDGVSVAAETGLDAASVFKTLVTKGASGAYYVFDIPVAENLDLKKAAKAVGEKSIAMLPQKELLPLTGYVHGGCSPVGMKKQFPTVFHETVNDLELVAVSAGKIGHQVQVKPADLLNLLRAKTADVIVEESFALPSDGEFRGSGHEALLPTAAITCCGAQNFAAAFALVVPSVQRPLTCSLNGALP